jgi:hypothetical protein
LFGAHFLKRGGKQHQERIPARAVGYRVKEMPKYFPGLRKHKHHVYIDGELAMTE